MTLIVNDMLNDHNDTKGGVSVSPAQWEQRRYEIAKAVLPAVYADAVDDLLLDEIAHDAVRLADALIDELKKTKRDCPLYADANDLVAEGWVKFENTKVG